eukprot:GHRQ01023218.1.p2 GENE.GHRQ01023218.1~~GHRQ01023218.1.p2  ORF type:complete len:135 (+),score=34.43 GHRQ01023218.1:410-814(+)
MEKVSFGSSGAVGHEAGPKDSPAVVVLQEWWGVNDIIKEHAHLIGDAGGFRVLIPDLYKGKVGVDKEEASHVSAPAGGPPEQVSRGRCSPRAELLVAHVPADAPLLWWRFSLRCWVLACRRQHAKRAATCSMYA